MPYAPAADLTVELPSVRELPPTSDVQDEFRSMSAIGLLLRQPRPAVAQGDCPIQYQRAGPTVAIDGKVSQTLELHARTGFGGRQARFHRATGERLERRSEERRVGKEC